MFVSIFQQNLNFDTTNYKLLDQRTKILLSPKINFLDQQPTGYSWIVSSVKDFAGFPTYWNQIAKAPQTKNQDTKKFSAYTADDYIMIISAIFCGALKVKATVETEVTDEGQGIAESELRAGGQKRMEEEPTRKRARSGTSDIAAKVKSNLVILIN